MTKKNSSRTELLQAIQLRKVYRVGAVDIEALKEISFSLYPGEFVALQGPSGSGKSTLLNVLGLLERPTAGMLKMDGASLIDASENALTDLRQRKIGFIFQNFNLIPVLSAAENVEYALYLERNMTRVQVRQRAMECIEAVGLSRFAKHKPAELSGGQRQRVAIARALVKRPELILADEPTANLDSKTAAQILELITNLQKNSDTSVVVATHDQATAAYAQRVIKIRDGVVEYDGPKV